ncbi:TonB-dependent receptor [Haliea sp. E17]|uniref:TonB-dependent receptor n=1 Tax=Haliea sp. E17 TaxID=3401576 RepID=UPI003AAF0695
MNNRIMQRAVLLAIAGAGCVPAIAQQTAETTQPTLEIVEVIAQRSRERLVDVPISITALNDDQLQRSGIESTRDLGRLTPGLELTFNGGYLQPAIRGVTSAGSDAGDSSNVAMYLDGVYMASQASQLMDLPDAQQIEILKGPQGTLYGQNATGGAIIITTRAPNTEELEGRISASYGDYDDAEIKGYISGPLADMVAGSLAFAYRERDGYRDQIVFGGSDKGLDSQMLRGKLLYQPNDSMDFTLSGFWSDREDSSLYAGQAWERNSVGYLFYPGAPFPDAKETAYSFTTDSDFEAWGASLLANFELPFGTLTSTTAYVDTEVKQWADVDYSPANYADVSVNQFQDNWVQEFNFVSEQFGKWRFSGGLFYLNGTDSFDPNIFRLQSPPTLAPVPEGPTVYTSISIGHIEKEIMAIYAEANYDITEALALTVGGRYSEEDQDTWSNGGGPGIEELPSPYNTESFSQFTPRVTLRYALSDNSNVYLSYGEGFKSGLLSIAAYDSPPVKPEKLDAWEIGYKGYPTESLSLSAAAYYYDYSDLQVARYIAPDYIYQNAASAEIHGAEVNAGLEITENLVLSAGISWLDAEYTDFPEAGIFAPSPTGGNINVNIDASGEAMIRAPDWTGFINANYTRDTAIGQFGAFASWYYNDGFNFEVSGRIHQESYSLLDGELSYTPAAAPRLKLALWGRNLTDEDYLQSLLQTALADGVSYGAPRTYGVRLEFTL